MNTIEVKVGTYVLTAARDVDLPQEFAAWHQTVRIEPGTYDVYAILEFNHDRNKGYRIRDLSARCEGVTISSDFRSHVLGTWGKSDNNRNGERATALIYVPTYGYVDSDDTYAKLTNERLAAATLLDGAFVRVEHVPHGGRRMWRLEWSDAAKLVYDKGQAYQTRKTATVAIEAAA